MVGAIAPKLEQAEIDRAKRTPTESLDAYDYFLRGMAAFHLYTRESSREALSLFYKAIELDPTFATAYGTAARCYAQRKSSGWVTDRTFESSETARLAQQARLLGSDDAVALFGAGIGVAYVLGDLDDGDALVDEAIALNPNLAAAWFVSGWVKVWRGEPDAGIERVAHAMRLSPHDSITFNMQSATAAGHFFAGRYREALSWAESAIKARPNFMPPTVIAAASAALLGNDAATSEAMARLRELMPELRVSNLSDFFPIRRTEDLQRWAEGMRRAGLPE